MSRMPGSGSTVYSGSTFDEPPPPWQAFAAKLSMPTISTRPASGASGSRPASFFSRTAISWPMRRLTSPCSPAGISVGAYGFSKCPNRNICVKRRTSARSRVFISSEVSFSAFRTLVSFSHLASGISRSMPAFSEAAADRQLQKSDCT